MYEKENETESQFNQIIYEKFTLGSQARASELIRRNHHISGCKNWHRLWLKKEDCWRFRHSSESFYTHTYLFTNTCTKSRERTGAQMSGDVGGWTKLSDFWVRPRRREVLARAIVSLLSPPPTQWTLLLCGTLFPLYSRCNSESPWNSLTPLLHPASLRPPLHPTHTQAWISFNSCSSQGASLNLCYMWTFQKSLKSPQSSKIEDGLSMTCTSC